MSEKSQGARSDRVDVSGLLEFPAGLPGFEEHKQFILESRAELRPFLWLRSVSDKEVALPVISCRLLKKQMLHDITDDHLSLLNHAGRDDITPYYILRVEPEGGTITANTKAPVIISTKNMQGCQVILEEDDLRVDEPLVNLLPSQGGM